MGRKRRYTIDVMVNTVNEILEGKSSVSMKANELNIQSRNIYGWISGYQKYGIDYFESRPRNNSYSKEFKEMVIKEYLEGKVSYTDLSLKYGIRSDSTILNWVSKYNRLEVIKDYDPKGEVYMSKRRKITLEDRIEIVKYCIDNNYDYKGAASTFNVSYAQVYSWTKKFIDDGEHGLTDNRGKRKVEEELTELERLQRENMLLKKQLERKDMENILLKKLKEIERRGFSQGSNKK